jgi:hypothetical protein
MMDPFTNNINNLLPKGDYADRISILQHEFAKKVRQSEEDILKRIIVQITGREATIEDAKDLTKCYYNGEPLNYDLAYKGQTIGKVRFELTGPNGSVTFYPTHLK